MAKYVCDVCGWEYDPEIGCPDAGIEPGTPWEEVPEDFECPLCAVGKDQFSEASRWTFFNSLKAVFLYLPKKQPVLE